MTVDLPHGHEAPRRPIPEPTGAPCEPTLVVPTDEFAMRITGIGGTGIVTVAQVLGTAAMLDGYFVRGLDQTGLSHRITSYNVCYTKLLRSSTTALLRGALPPSIRFDGLRSRCTIPFACAHSSAST